MFHSRGLVLDLNVRERVRATFVADQERIALREIARVLGPLQDLDHAPIRVVTLARRVGLVEDIVITGGVAKNKGVPLAIEKKLNIKLQGLNNHDPQIVGALGAALIAADFAVGNAIGL